MTRKVEPNTVSIPCPTCGEMIAVTTLRIGPPVLYDQMQAVERSTTRIDVAALENCPRHTATFTSNGRQGDWG